MLDILKMVMEFTLALTLAELLKDALKVAARGVWYSLCGWLASLWVWVMSR